MRGATSDLWSGSHRLGKRELNQPRQCSALERCSTVPKLVGPRPPFVLHWFRSMYTPASGIPLGRVSFPVEPCELSCMGSHVAETAVAKGFLPVTPDAERSPFRNSPALMRAIRSQRSDRYLRRSFLLTRDGCPWSAPASLGAGQNRKRPREVFSRPLSKDLDFSLTR